MSAPAEGVTVRAWRARLAVFACTLLAYSTSLHGPFQFDDFGVIVRYEPVHSLSGWWASAGHGLRPLLKLTYAASWAFGLGALGFHLTNLAVHLANVELVMRLYTAAAQRTRRWPFAASDAGAIAAGLLFAVHPIQTEAVTYISGRSSSLSTLFVLLALLLYAEAARARTSGPWLGLAAIAYVCAALTKESCAGLPAGLLLWELCIERGRGREVLLRQLGFWLLLVLLLVAAIMQRAYFVLLYQMSGARPLLEALWYQVAGAGYLISRLLLVERLSIDPGLGLHPPALASTAVVAAGLCGASWLVVAQYRRRPVVAFGLSWFLLELFFPYALLPRLEVLNERHMYLAGVGIFLALAALWVELVTRARLQRPVRAAGAAVVALLVSFTLQRNLDYGSATALWQSTVRVSSDNPRAYNNLGIVYEAHGRTVEARDAYARALALEQRYDSARRNLERVLRRMSQSKSR
jgi:hypothetical protein